MKKLKDTAIILSIAALFFALLELVSYLLLCRMGFNPFSAAQRYQYSRVPACYTVSDNTPNYRNQAFDSLGKPGRLVIDENGFATGTAKLTRQKPAGTVRIFIMGGSTAFGTIRMPGDEGDDTYPVGTYTYQAGIAGQLSAMLRQKYPATKFEVINAAVVGHQLHQNFARYFEKVHDFNPDVVITIAGYNDMLVFGDFDTSRGNITGDPYTNARWDFTNLLELETRARTRQWPFTVNLLNHYLDKAATPAGNQKSEQPKPTAYYNAEPDTNRYRLLEPVYCANAQKFLWVLNAYQHQLKADSVYAIFVLQPDLKRRLNQKTLSPRETKMRNNLERMPELDSITRARLITQWAQHQTRAVAGIAQQLMSGNSANITTLRDGFFYNRYLSPAIDSIVTAQGNSFIDFGKEITQLGADKEFYTDYCHLTAFGNWLVAQKLAAQLAPVAEHNRW